MIGLAPADQAIRTQLLSDLDSTFFVEAGAGTGKTTIVVQRIAELVANGRLEIRGLIAITFTEAAAAELRVRVREILEDTARDVARPPLERSRCQAAVDAIEDATIDTIHAFAAMILRTFPLEAGLPPGFEIMEPIEEQLELQDRFRQWFDGIAAKPEREIVRRCLLLGLQPKDIRATAGALQDQYDLLKRGMLWPTASRDDALDVAHQVGRQLAELRTLLKWGPGEDAAVTGILRLSTMEERLRTAATEDQALTALAEMRWVPSLMGRQGDWSTDPLTGSNTLKRMKAIHKAARETAVEAVSAYRGVSLAGLLGLLTDFALDWAATRKVEGRATFHDLLTWARDLVHDNAEVRGKLQARFTHLFIDEFQDTDPLQAELVIYLAAPPAAEMPEAWRTIQPVPGKLFVVGDPKQSIYRFRRADIALYQAIQDSVGNLHKLTSNFRSVPKVIDLVNHHFSGRITKQANAQPEYSALTAEQPDSGAAVWSFGDIVDGDQGAVWEAEADSLAAMARKAVDDGWQVSALEAGKRILRPAEYSDIMILIPTRGNLGRIGRALDALEVPYRLESGELVLATQEVRDLLSALRAMDDPSDEVALVAALRSPIYGCSDVDLLRWTETGGHLAYHRISDRAEGDTIRSALANLNDWHRRRHLTTVPALIERFLDERLLSVAAMANRRPEDYLRRYQHIVERARTFATTGRSTLRAFLDWMDDLRDEGQLALPGPPTGGPGDAVRIMTVHGAKGLEFPIVFMSGWHSKRQFNAPIVIADRVNGGLNVATGADRTFKTPGYDAAKEAESALNDAELIRMVYVAATRAKDHLVISLCRAEDKNQTKESAFLAESLESFESAIQVTDHAAPLVAPSAIVSDTSGVSAAPEDEIAAEDAWIDRHEDLLAGLGGLKMTTATGLAHLPDTSEERAAPTAEVAALRRGRGGTSLGRAVHAVLQSIDLATLADLDELARGHSAAEGIAERSVEVAMLVRSVCNSPSVRRAVASGSYWREVPIGVALNNTILEGYVDLVFAGAHGIEVVDYKTDSVSSAQMAERMNQYSLQGDAYRLALESATGSEVEQVTFVFAALGEEAIVPADPELRQRLIGLSG